MTTLYFDLDASVGAAVLGHVTGAARRLLDEAIGGCGATRLPFSPRSSGAANRGTGLRTPVRSHPRELPYAIHFHLILCWSETKIGGIETCHESMASNKKIRSQKPAASRAPPTAGYRLLGEKLDGFESRRSVRPRDRNKRRLLRSGCGPACGPSNSNRAGYNLVQ
ncbi:hypothetical protein THAOC_21793 [Thalassiosira oceanica]|uniref:Uncharacterized protein n=1 Tax=Thalassiosira oceanica TaxID=159749 RepID=K0S074_THAOC|nr:hypothetical protein THAOC_21793 [Thalassiosira oceanica]|eukprot:EJK58109.1 hypothetical protein THAOC_21793 [Thalassiosira oceanica]